MRPRPRQDDPAAEPVRLQVYLARSGIASRRASEELIRAGRVTVNGRVAEVGAKVSPDTDIVRVDRKVISEKPVVWLALHKPRGYVTTREDPEGRRTVYDLLPAAYHHLFHVGRLDRDSSGLLLFTNDGEAANRLLHPRYETTKEYRADVEGVPDAQTLRQLLHGVELEEGTARAVAVERKGEIEPGIARLIIVLHEGRNREVRRMLTAVGHPVVRLFRRRFATVEIGRLKPGAWRELTASEVASLSGQKKRKRGR